ncbi:hypothetical protein KCP73_09290 [Salmonella enterica subsp. enterica]|nr:hypothetical protein KCP73_09290 [Salmonella enterica subsp. enterica]
MVYRSGPDEERRRAAVTNWKRMIEIAVDMGVQVINTELSGTPDEPETVKRCGIVYGVNRCRS